MTDEIEWVDAPPPPRRTGPPGGRLAMLLAHPGKWAAFHYDNANTATAIGPQLKRRAAKQGIAVETTSRRNPDGTGTLYARVVES